MTIVFIRIFNESVMKDSCVIFIFFNENMMILDDRDECEMGFFRWVGCEILLKCKIQNTSWSNVSSNKTLQKCRLRFVNAISHNRYILLAFCLTSSFALLPLLMFTKEYYPITYCVPFLELGILQTPISSLPLFKTRVLLPSNCLILRFQVRPQFTS